MTLHEKPKHYTNDPNKCHTLGADKKLTEIAIVILTEITLCIKLILSNVYYHKMFLTVIKTLLFVQETKNITLEAK